MAILVTGAAGFIGSHLVDRLLGDGEAVVGVDSFDDFYDPALKQRNLEDARGHGRFTEVPGDIRDPGVLDRAPDDVDLVIHMAARPGVRSSIEHPALYASVNVEGTLRVLEFARARGIGRLLFASSSSVYGEGARLPFTEDDPADRPISPYAATKRAAELLCHTYHHLYGVSVVALRFFTAHGPRQRPDLAIHRFARLMRRGEPIPVYGDGSSERDYTYVDDIVGGVVGALAFVRRSAPVFEIVNLGESRTVSLTELIDVLADEMGVTPRIERLPSQPGDMRRTFADIGKARRLLGYEPSTALRDGVRAFLRWMDSRNEGE